MSQSELARIANVSRQAIFAYESHARINPQVEILSAISLALGYSSRHLPVMAGKIPPEPTLDEELEKINELYNKLKDPESKKRAEDYLKLLLSQEVEKGKFNVSKSHVKPAKP